MPRFTTRTMLIACGVAALWFASFSGNDAGDDLRRSMLLLLLVISASLAIFRHGKRRVFWAAFAIVMLLCGGLESARPLNRYVPAFAWRAARGMPNQFYQPSPYAPTTITYAVPPTPATSAPVVYPNTPVAYAVAAQRPFAWYAVGETFAAVWTIGLATLSGCIAAYISGRRATERVAASPIAKRIIEEEMARDA